MNISMPQPTLIRLQPRESSTILKVPSTMISTTRAILSTFMPTAIWTGWVIRLWSITGYGGFLGPCLVSWCAKKQLIVSRSSTEEEDRALAITVVEFYWLRMVLKDLQVPQPITTHLWCHNIGALALVSNPVFNACTEHIEVDFHVIHEKVVNKDVCLRFIHKGALFCSFFFP